MQRENIPYAALCDLRDNQRQANEDNSQVTVSRESLREVLAFLDIVIGEENAA